MKLYREFCEYLSNLLHVDLEHISLFLNTVLVVLVIFLLKKISVFLVRPIKDERKEFLVNQRIKITLNVMQVVFLIFVWDEYIKSLITLVSFLSAGFVIALRDIIFNWFSGIYNRIKKVFKVEDRIEIEGIKGDVIMISTLGFEMLEVGTNEENGQSTGVIINYPNSVIFSKPVKNLTKGFKYVWNEMVVKVPIDCDLAGTKKELYKILNSIDEIKNTPGKMQNAVKNINAEYHIYYNQYNPIIYTKVVDDHVELTIRYLINPKKARFIESRIWNQILVLHQNNKICLLDKE